MTEINCIGSALNRISNVISGCLFHVVLSIASLQFALHELHLVEVQDSETQTGSMWGFSALKCGWVRNNLEK